MNKNHIEIGDVTVSIKGTCRTCEHCQDYHPIDLTFYCENAAADAVDDLQDMRGICKSYTPRSQE